MNDDWTGLVRAALLALGVAVLVAMVVLSAAGVLG